MRRVVKLSWVLAGLLLPAALALASGGAEGAKAEKVSITFMNMWVRGEMMGFTYPLDLVEAYVKAHPNVEVKMDSIQHDAYLTVKFKTAAAANQLPEVFQINSMDMRSSVKAGRLMEWTDALNADPKWKDAFIPVFNEVTFDGKIYAIPYQFITNELIFYNSEILKQAGYDKFPQTWEDTMAYAEKAKGMGLIPIALGIKAGWPMVSHFVEPLCEYVCGPEWVKEIGTFTGKRGYDEPDFVAVLKLLDDAVKKGYFNKDLVAVDNVTEDKAYFYNRKAAMLPGGSYSVRSVVKNAPPDLMPVIEIAPIPRPSISKPSVKYGIFTGGSGWEFGANTRLTEAQRKVVVDIVRVLTGPEYARYDVESMRIPVVNMKYVTGWDSSKVPKLQQDVNRLISAAPGITLMNQQQSGPAISDALYKTLQEMVVGSVTPEQAAKKIQTVYERVVADYKKQ